MRGWHASSFLVRNMRRSAAWVPVVTVAVLTLYPRAAQVGPAAAQDGSSPAPVSARSAPAPPPPSVTLEHRLIEVRPAPRLRPAPRSIRRPLATRLTAALLPRDTLVMRARRVVVGDGRFRPEPFPRLDR